MRLDIDLCSQADGGRALLSVDCITLTVLDVVGALRLQVVVPTSSDSLSTRLLAVSTLLANSVKNFSPPSGKPEGDGGSHG